MMAIRCAGSAFIFGSSGLDVRFRQQFVGHHIGIADVKILFSPVPDFASGDLPLGSAGADWRRARLPFQLTRPVARKSSSLPGNPNCPT